MATEKPETKTALMQVRIRPSTKAAAAEAATRDGRSLSNYIERLILRDVAENSEHVS